MLKILIIADDLTGAADCAAACAAHGLDTLVVLDDSSAIPSAEVVAFDTNTRDATPELAAAATARIVESYSASIVFKKIDSTMRGNVAVEVSAALDAYRKMGHPDAVSVVAPAFPAMGRTTRDGCQFVRGVAVGDGGLAALQNAETDEDLSAIAARWVGRDVLWVGSAGLMGALMPRYEKREWPAPPKANGPIIFAVGSLSERSHEQVDALKASGVGSDLVFTGEAESLASTIAQRREQIGGLVLTGGDTARAVLRGLGIAALRIVGEVETGVPILMVEASGLPVITKAGDFGDRETLMRCRAALRRA